jgi:hypothetical protein
MSQAENTAEKTDAQAAAAPGGVPKPKIHRVCITCNNMFVVTADRYDAKQCPNCHKG